MKNFKSDLIDVVKDNLFESPETLRKKLEAEFPHLDIGIDKNSRNSGRHVITVNEPNGKKWEVEISNS